MGIEPTCEAWKASVLPLNYARLRALRFGAASPQGPPRTNDNDRRLALSTATRYARADEFAAADRRTGG